jgi:hypothetical protein
LPNDFKRSELPRWKVQHVLVFSSVGEQDLQSPSKCPITRQWTQYDVSGRREFRVHTELKALAFVAHCLMVNLFTAHSLALARNYP